MTTTQVNQKRVSYILDQLEYWRGESDPERRHGKADEYLCQLIEALCPEELENRVAAALETYRTMTKWYA